MRSFSHDALNRYLEGEKLSPKLTWENVQNQVVQSPNGFVVFDDTVADKNFSHKTELVRRQYSGNAHAVIKGIGIITCVYINPELDQFWIIDFGVRSIEVQPPAQTDIASFKTIVMEQFPVLKGLMVHILISVNHEYAFDDAIIPEAAEIALFPPVSGG